MLNIIMFILYPGQNYFQSISPNLNKPPNPNQFLATSLEIMTYQFTMHMINKSVENKLW
ncbi:hypothetical protein PO909_003591 [Leuciscus waleckii]